MGLADDRYLRRTVAAHHRHRRADRRMREGRVRVRKRQKRGLETRWHTPSADANGHGRSHLRVRATGALKSEPTIVHEHCKDEHLAAPPAVPQRVSHAAPEVFPLTYEAKCTYVRCKCRYHVERERGRATHRTPGHSALPDPIHFGRWNPRCTRAFHET